MLSFSTKLVITVFSLFFFGSFTARNLRRCNKRDLIRNENAVPCHFLEDRKDYLLKYLLERELNRSSIVWNCDREWKSLEFFLPVYLNEVNTSRNDEWLDIFTTSLQLFWPIKDSKVVLNLVVDEGTENSTLFDKHIGNVIRDKRRLHGDSFVPTKIVIARNEVGIYETGHDKQQYIMFYADNYTTSEYVGFIDTDTIIHSFVDREDIFEEGLPVVHGRLSQYKKVGRDKIKRLWAESTYRFLGVEEPMMCMAYFPVVIKTAHLKDLRIFVEQKWKKSFPHAFAEFTKSVGWGKYSQFHIMCAYLWYNKNEEYRWYVHDTHPWWDGVGNQEPAYGQLGDKENFKPEMFLPKPFISNHLSVRFMDYEKHDVNEHMRMLFAKGLCWGFAAQGRTDSLFVLPINNASKLGMLLNDSLDCRNLINLRPGFNTNLTSDNDYQYNDETLIFDDANYNPEYITNRTILNLVQQDRARRFKSCSSRPIYI